MCENVKLAAAVKPVADEADLVKPDDAALKSDDAVKPDFDEERFEAMLEFISSAGDEEWRGLDYPLLLEKFSIDEAESEERMMDLFGMSGYDVAERMKTGDYIGMSLVGDKYHGCLSNI